MDATTSCQSGTADGDTTSKHHIRLDENLPRPQPRGEESVGDDGDDGADSIASEYGDYELRTWWIFKLRGYDDDLARDWWFASTAIPLLAATIAPLANVTSIAALVTYWRMKSGNGDNSLIPDPRSYYYLNLVSLICGFLGNIFLLFNFTGRVRYLISLPLSIAFFYIATGILVAITISMNRFYKPVTPYEMYTQGYWYAVISALFYFIISTLQIVNLLGYLLGHYPQSFDLTDSQRTLILQTMLFFIWLAGGAAVFARVEKNSPVAVGDWSFVNALYFCDVTILTVGFGDLYPSTDTGRGLVFPYSVGGIVFLGLVISSITKFAGELSEDNVIKRHIERRRHRTISRAISEPDEIRQLEARRDARVTSRGKHVEISAPSNGMRLRTNLRFAVYNRHDHHEIALHRQRRSSKSVAPKGFQRKANHVAAAQHETNRRGKRLVILRDEKDRFEAMRRIQQHTQKFKRYFALCMSVIAFGLLWCVGAVVFWLAEKETQGLSYFQSLYFAYVSLLTIGYGDLAPKSNPGRCFFVVWSLIAVPTMTILVNAIGSTVIASFQKGTFRFADFTLLPKKGVWREYIETHPRLFRYLQRRKQERDAAQRLKEGMKFPDEDGGVPATDPDMPNDASALHPDPDRLEREIAADEAGETEDRGLLARRLAAAIRTVASDLRSPHQKKYTFEEWAEITRLIRFTSGEARGDEQADVDAVGAEEESEGVVRWDWLGENSPMMVGQTEPEFVLDRLCESLGRYMSRVESAGRRAREKGVLIRNDQVIFARDG